MICLLCVCSDNYTPPCAVTRGPVAGPSTSASDSRCQAPQSVIERGAVRRRQRIAALRRVEEARSLPRTPQNLRRVGVLQEGHPRRRTYWRHVSMLLRCCCCCFAALLLLLCCCCAECCSLCIAAVCCCICSAASVMLQVFSTDDVAAAAADVLSRTQRLVACVGPTSSRTAAQRTCATTWSAATRMCS